MICLSRWTLDRVCVTRRIDIKDIKNGDKRDRERNVEKKWQEMGQKRRERVRGFVYHWKKRNIKAVYLRKS